MHVFGLMMQAPTLRELDEIVSSTAVVFSSSHSGENVDKHFQNLQLLLTRHGLTDLDEPSFVEENFVVSILF